jgi:opacity protein-like surface antigen
MRLRHVLILVLLLLLSVLFASAQTAPTPLPAAPQPNDDVHVTAGLSYALLTNGAGTGVNVTKLDVAVPLTDRFSLVYNQYIIPSAQANVFIGGVRYSLFLSSLIKPTASTKIDLSKFQVYADLGAGTKRDSITNLGPTFSIAVNGGLRYNLASNLVISIEGGYIHTGKIKGGHNFLFGNSPVIAPGIKLTF